MLHELLSTNRNELIRRCRAKAARRFEPAAVPAVVDHGVPLFLQQLIDTLAQEQLTKFRHVAGAAPTATKSAIGLSAALHGAELLALGYTVDQVVRDYGDVCQTATDLAVEQHARIDAGEFRTLNRCLDEAIADAVTAFGDARLANSDEKTLAVHERLESFAGEQQRLIDIAIQSYEAIKAGKIGVAGATGALLAHTLHELRSLAGRALAAPGPAARQKASAAK